MSWPILEGEPDTSVHTVTIDDVARGIRRILSEGNPIGLNKTIISAVAAASVENDAGEIDVEVADCILQAGIFDEYRYG